MRDHQYGVGHRGAGQVPRPHDHEQRGLAGLHHHGHEDPGRRHPRLALGGRVPPVTARAARAYLDICFFHPFDDGNARSAFLILLFVLAREGITLNGVGLLRRVTFQADSPQDGLALARYIDVSLADE